MTVFKEKCHVCGNVSEFNIADSATLLRDAVCSNCGASVRTSDLAYVLLNELNAIYSSLEEADDKLPIKKILNTSSSGFIHEYLKFYPGYRFSEYFKDVESGCYKNGVLCVDLCNIPFRNKSLDFIISEDIFEHISDYEKAFVEIYRVLKDNGKHIFTVPLHENKLTISRLNNENKVYHGDPIRPNEGCIVCTDFGKDIGNILEKFGFAYKIIVGHKFFDKDEITDVDKTYNEYLAHKSCAEKYFKYNSIVIVSEKKAKKLSKQTDFSGVRFSLEMDDEELAIEHLQRYRAVCDMVKDKDVLDAACGEGYGSYMLAKIAKTVVGVDIDEKVIIADNEKYRDVNNLTFIQASISNLYMVADHSKDVIISFETIEHVAQNIQEKFIKEIKRILTPEGVLIMSTPDKMEYSDRFNFHNKFHVREFYRDEFINFISKEFYNIALYYQFLEVASFIKSADIIEEKLKYYENSNMYIPKPKYLIVVASNAVLPRPDLSSIYMHERDEYYSLKDQITKQKLRADVKANTNKLFQEELDRRAEELEKRMNLLNTTNSKLSEAVNQIKLQNSELERRAEELNKRMDLINTTNRKLLEAENQIKLQNDELDRRADELNKRMDLINEINNKLMVSENKIKLQNEELDRRAEELQNRMNLINELR